MRTLSDAELATIAVDRPAAPMGMAEAAAAIAGTIGTGRLLVAAADEQQAAQLAAALGGAAPHAAVIVCPGSDALPGDDAPASPGNIGQRVSALRRLRLATGGDDPAPIILVTTGEGLARAYAPPAAYEAAPPMIAVGEAIDLAALHADLITLGYRDDDRVDEPGEVAVRGQVIDVFPADALQPLRIEIEDGIVAAIRCYDPVDQRGTAEIDRCEIGHAAEPAIGADRTTLVDHLPDGRVLVLAGADDRRRRLLLLTADATRRGSKRAARDLVSAADWDAVLASRTSGTITRGGDAPPRFVEQASPMRAFGQAARAAIADGERIVLMGRTGDLRFLLRRVAKAIGTAPDMVADWQAVQAAAPGAVLAIVMPAERGFRRDGIFAVAAADLIGSRAERDPTAVSAVDASAVLAGDVRVGDVVIHEDHGIGVVAGLEAMPTAGDGDAIKLTYAGDATRLVPVAEADRLWRYGAEADAITLDRLDGSSWHKRRGEIDATIAESARALTALAAERSALHAPVLDPDPAAYERFAAGFPFTETADQRTAIDAVRADLASGRPMDRLVVGDVGFGKTEVALRAAAIAALAGRQVAVAAPTTVLARQHLEAFRQRFEGTDIVVAGLSRLSSAAEKKQVKAGLADGSVRIVVGTGAVGGKGIAYADLALVIIDEEQRFGAADKQRLQALSAGHVLALSATPIPRTLQSALVGLRQLSIIATPPARRQPIRTSVRSFAAETLRAALLLERSRGGQSFVVVPRIADMARLSRLLHDLVPELEILEAHGKLPAAEIDETMVRFGRGDGDVLLATNIIEAGLDVPRANTMAILHADRFGLSQLHQLRGRVGRGGRRGQVLLFTDADQAIAPHTLKRLHTLEAFDRLGAGFAISANDLDMRGAGDLLGETQAGHMRLIGVAFYQQLLEGALRTARGETVDRWAPQLNLGLSGCLPGDWLPDVDMRISLYARLSRIADAEALDALADELADRFGTLPDEAERLIAVARVRLAARALSIARIDAGPGGIALTPRPGADLSALSPALERKGARFVLGERIADPAARLDRLVALLGDAAAIH